MVRRRGTSVGCLVWVQVWCRDTYHTCSFLAPFLFYFLFIYLAPSLFLQVTSLLPPRIPNSQFNVGIHTSICYLSILLLVLSSKMAARPIFTLTHPRACSTAFERVFMTRRDILEIIHEPFGDAFYFGPEFLSDRFKDGAATREASTFSKITYKDILDQMTEAGNRVCIIGSLFSFSSHSYSLSLLSMSTDCKGGGPFLQFFHLRC